MKISEIKKEIDNTYGNKVWESASDGNMETYTATITRVWNNLIQSATWGVVQASWFVNEPTPLAFLQNFYKNLPNKETDRELSTHELLYLFENFYLNESFSIKSPEKTLGHIYAFLVSPILVNFRYELAIAMHQHHKQSQIFTELKNRGLLSQETFKKIKELKHKWFIKQSSTAQAFMQLNSNPAPITSSHEQEQKQTPVTESKTDSDIPSIEIIIRKDDNEVDLPRAKI